MSLHIDVITIFPGMLDGFLKESMLKIAVEKNAVEFNVVNLRDFATGPHRSTDDRPFGGGPGMVMTPDPLFKAITSLKREKSRVIFMTPRGKPFKQSRAIDLAGETHLIFVCGHYEGIDERVVESLVDEEISIGDYVLTNGVLPAAVIIDSVVRLLPGVLGGEGATEAESFMDGLLEYPQYTRPADYNGLTVPDVLLSGNHAEIAKWRQEQAYKITKNIRPDLLDNENLGGEKK
ncbi:MAG: tRNA (guanosine(37)-N1)-methyltransferase TrmD [Kiritimatiellae bacterium]|jgi:tRNA (guanine37-N1)-methyltransferase|nr:tRNA (guanosine(37)-N1)-methyltransferase TrmD [Kiritimatiellia bacterium]